MTSIVVDRQIFSDEVISKAIYWETEKYNISRELQGTHEQITFSLKHYFNDDETLLNERFLTRLNDYKLRQIISNETKDIRTILYIKAFAHDEDIELPND